MEESKPLIELVDSIIDKAAVENQKFALAVKNNTKINVPYKQSMDKHPDGTKTPKEGYLMWVFKRNAQKKTKTGEIRQETAPTLYDSNGLECNHIVGSNSMGRVKFTFYAYSQMSNGVYFELQEFQITELVAPGGASKGFEKIENGFVSDQNDAAVSIMEPSEY